LLVSIKRLGKYVITGENHDDWQILIHKSQDPVLELSGHDGLTMEIGDFFDL